MHLKPNPAKVIEQYRADHGASNRRGGKEHGSHLLREHHACHGGHDTQQTSQPGPPRDLCRLAWSKSAQLREGDRDEQRY